MQLLHHGQLRSISADALFQRATRLPRVDARRPESVI
jgi:hypothetical protein